ncbi:S8 family serine peptidase [Natrononativus amylolyticus]|uniref:S8 family serine peptidase n=1 Tax=Natrononativus amylolyticus TaxID=2963434 RepID=UPI0020CF2731|nr:S8 family serine peptidase [Natrononativus amylolyticus]
MRQRTKRINGVVLSLIMVLSMVAIGAVGAGGATTTSEDGQASAPAELSAQGDVSIEEIEETHDAAAVAVDRQIGEAIDDGEDELALVLALEQPTVTATDGEVVRAQLEDHAAATQEPVLDRLAESDAAEVRNTFWLSNLVAVTTDADERAIAELRELPGVEAIHLSQEIEPIEPVEQRAADPGEEDEYTYGLEQINAPEFWDEYSTMGEGSTVAIIDDGIDPAHPDLELYTDDPDDPTYPGGFEAFDANGEIIEGVEPSSDTGHGDHVSGTATGGDASGTAIGVAPEADLLHADVFYDSAMDVTIVGAMEWAVENDADVASMSLGIGCGLFGGPAYEDIFIEPIDNARSAGTVVVTSAGNGGDGCVSAPATDYDSFSIGSSNEAEDISDFSSGMVVEKDEFDDPPEEWPDSFVKPDVAAPGEDVYSAGPDGEGYDILSGTSMSSPHIAGTVGLFRSADPDLTVEEIEEALEETAWKPDDWDEPDDEKDTRYGMGIIDVTAAAEELDLGVGVPEYELGDVNEDGVIDNEDVQLTRQYLQDRIDEDELNTELADVTRSGNVTDEDLRLIRQLRNGQADPGQIEVSNLEGPDEVDEGDAVQVSADLENVGDVGAIEAIELRLADSADDLDENATVATAVSDLAPDGEESVTLTASTDGLAGGEYAYGIFADEGAETSELTVLNPHFEVTGLEAPDEVERGDEIDVEATVENTGNAADEQDVEFRFDDLEDAVATEDVTLEAGEETTVAFENVTVDAEGGTYDHGVFTDDDSLTAELTVLEAHFAVSDVDGPAEVAHGEEITVTATVENTGEATDTQSLAYELGDAPGDVAVVGSGVDAADEALLEDLEERTGDSEFESQDLERIDPHGVENTAETLADELDEHYTVDAVHDGDLLDVTDEYDVFVINDLSNVDLGDFLAELDDDQGVVYLENWGSGSDGISALAEERDDLSVSTSFSGDGSVDYELHEDHPIFTGVGEAGETITMYDVSSADRAWFDGYDGTVLADGGLDGASPDGSAVGVGDEENEILLTLGRTTWVADDDYTDEANALLANAVEYVNVGSVSGQAAAAQADEPAQSVELEPGESTTVEFEYVVSEDDGLGDAAHVVSSADHEAFALTKVDAPELVEVTDLEAPANATQGDEYAVEATLEHTGWEETTQTVEFVFDDEVEATETVSLEPGEETVVAFEAAVPKDLEPGDYQQGVEVRFDDEYAPIEIEEGEEAHFELSDFEAPAHVGQGETLTVSVDVENTGDFEGTQEVTYEFDVGTDDDDGIGDPEDVSVAVVDEEDYHEGALVAVLEDRLDADVYEVDLLEADDLLDSMDDYDAFVVQRIGSDDLAEDFLGGLEDDQGAVYLDSYQGGTAEAYADGVYRLHNVRENPGERDEDATATDGEPVEIEIHEDHPIFDGVGSAGDTVEVYSGSTTWGAWFDDYDGTVLADADFSAGDDGVHEGPSIAVNDDENEVLATAVARDFFTDEESFTDEGNMLLANAVEHVSAQAAAGASTSADADATAGADFDLASVEQASADDFEIQQDGFLPLSVSEEVSLEGGESTTVEFEYEVADNQRPDYYEHGVFSADDEVTDGIEVDRTRADIGVTGYFLDPDPAEEDLRVGDTLTAEAVVVNQGDAAGEYDVTLYEDSSPVDTETVSLEPDEVDVVDLSFELEEAGTSIVSVNGVDPVQIEVEPAEENGTASMSLEAGTASPAVGALG